MWANPYYKVTQGSQRAWIRAQKKWARRSEPMGWHVLCSIFLLRLHLHRMRIRRLTGQRVLWRLHVRWRGLLVGAGGCSRGCRCRLSDGLAGNYHLDAAILLPSGCCAIRCDGHALSEAAAGDVVGFRSLADKKIVNRLGATF